MMPICRDKNILNLKTLKLSKSKSFQVYVENNNVTIGRYRDEGKSELITSVFFLKFKTCSWLVDL